MESDVGQFDRDLEIKRDAKLVIIATEGEKTEKLYFTNFNDSRVRVHILPSADGRSSPEAVLLALEVFAEKYQIAEGDEFWLVVDVDHWVANVNLQPVVQLCRQRNYEVAVSNPCFELWLLLHFDDAIDVGSTCRNMVTQLRRHVTYSKTKLDFDKYSGHIDEAVARASAITVGGVIPNRLGTNVFRLVQSLKGLTRC